MLLKLASRPAVPAAGAAVVPSSNIFSLNCLFHNYRSFLHQAPYTIVLVVSKSNVTCDNKLHIWSLAPCLNGRSYVYLTIGDWRAWSRRGGRQPEWLASHWSVSNLANLFPVAKDERLPITGVSLSASQLASQSYQL